MLHGPELDLREWKRCVPTKKHKTISQIQFFLMEKYVEDVRQDEKHVPDLLESIMKPKDLVKDELRQKLFKINQFGSKIKKMRVSTFWIPEIQKFPAGGQCQPSRPVGFKQETAFQNPINPIFGPARGQIYEKMRVIAL